MLRHLLYFLIAVNGYFSLNAQADSLPKTKKHKLVLGNDSNVVFSGTRIVTKTDTGNIHKIELSGYVSAYYAHYSDETTNNGFVQFPTMAPRNNQFGLNLAQIGMEYHDQKVRGNITLQYGDIPETNWPKPFTLIQEAHVGVQLVKKLWLDAGFFKSHIGLESIQPRENITSSMSIIDYYEPYYFSGAKLTYQVNTKLSLQVNAFNGYNTYIETNKNKAIGFSALYDVNDNISITYNALSCDETPDNIKTKHQRFYHNLYGTFKLRKLSFGIEANYGTQKNSVLFDSTKTASMNSALIVLKYQAFKKVGIYGRAEYFSDKNKILTGNLNLGNYIYGGTIGLEFKPAKNVALSAEYRVLKCEKFIFKEKNYLTNQRDEIIFCLDVWF
jgi:hypothetical protein